MDSQNGHEPRRSSAMSTMPMLRGMGSGVVRSSLSNGVDGAYMPQQHPRQFVTRDEVREGAEGLGVPRHVCQTPLRMRSVHCVRSPLLQVAGRPASQPRLPVA